MATHLFRRRAASCADRLSTAVREVANLAHLPLDVDLTAITSLRRAC
jgi:hypothetical protein